MLLYYVLTVTVAARGTHIQMSIFLVYVVS